MFKDFEEPPYCLAQWLCHFTFPSAMYQVPISPHLYQQFLPSLPTIVLPGFFKNKNIFIINFIIIIINFYI